MEQIDKLRQREKKQVKSLLITRRKIEEIENSEIIPAMRKKYEGKYFKYHNAYDSKRKWWLYYRCDKITDVNYFEGISFQDDKEGKMEINIEKNSFISGLQIEITKSEYNKALNAFMKKITKTVTKIKHQK